MKKLLILLLCSVHIATWAQNSERKFVSFKANKNQLEITVSDGKYVIKPYSESIVETAFVPNDEVLNPESHAVVLVPKSGLAKVKDYGNQIVLNTSGINVKITKSPFQIAYNYKGKTLLSEKNGYTKKDSTQTLDFNLDATEALYGGGARALGLNRRGNKLKLRNQAHYGYGDRSELLNFSIPMVLSSKIYAVHFDNASLAELDLDSQKNNTLAYQPSSGRKTYQVIAGDRWEDLIQNYTQLTGTQPLLPRWAFGNFASRFGYHDQDQVEKTIKKFEQDQIPVDAIILDLYWFGKKIQGTLGNLEWDRETFSNPEKMMADLNAKNIKTILITEPFILTTSSKWQEADAKKVLATEKSGKSAIFDFYFGNGGIVDVFKPEGKTWFWNIYKNLANQGVGGWWGDLGEPEAFPSKVITAKGKASEVHNIYGHNWAKMVFEGYQKDFPNVRPFILMRAGYSGSQRYGMVPWSGDVSRSWNGLQSQPEISLGMGLQGIGFMHSDLGGFAGDYFDNELYLRWLQYGVFQPIFRPHAHDDVAPEPVYKDIVTKAAAKKQVELRYQLLPYNYSIAYENAVSGAPLMRPMFFEEPNNTALYNDSSTYLWGDAFLVHPIVKPGVAQETIYFPKGSNWFDFYTGHLFGGGRTESVKVTADHIPTFVRSNAFVPMIATIQNTSAYTLSRFDMHFYWDPTKPMRTFTLYHDDGQTPDASRKNQSETVNFSCTPKANVILISVANRVQKDAKVQDKHINLIVHNLSSAKKVSVNGKNVTFKVADNSLEIPVFLEKGTTKDIKIER
ncbi:glycoside hydrolase family 31 protein [Flavobacterium caeni]|uniref:Oligosaccharide 4-alpha-D-glucosyltransferase n=1 Tax=Flavobacterium caeni TaxID=490189 RepID=A0A1G5GGV8_9FLAO|nr:TIM-barrel domain-containing protein [Flavobacterium caeni]SCY50577.1 oligosaccharide 4-alpha-D-glucosyltransferase [Flavobacterium caeni]